MHEMTQHASLNKNSLTSNARESRQIVVLEVLYKDGIRSKTPFAKLGFIHQQNTYHIK
jgi:hypothetical protein